MKQTTKQWIKYCVATSAVMILMSVTLNQIIYAPIIGLIGFGVVYKIPWYKRKKIAGEIERELPLALRSMSTLTAIGLPFEEALKQCCEKTELAHQLKRALREAELGATVPEALSSMAHKIDSYPLQKAVLQLNTLYAKKGDASSLKKLSDEIVSTQKASLREYSGKLVVYSLLFIAVSAILPALFQAYVIVGSSFMSSNISSEQAFWIPVAFFPIVDAGMLVFIKLKKPFFA